MKPEQFKHLSTYLIAKEAEDRGIKVEKLITSGFYYNSSLLKFELDGHVEHMVGQRTTKTDSVAYWLQKNKYYTKLFLAKHGLSVSPGEIFGSSQTDEIARYAAEIGFPVVAKKVGGTHGTDVYVNIENEEELREIVSRFSGSILIEKMFVGTEYRMFATKDRFVAATKRIPANVVGDGQSNIEKLVEVKNADPRRSDGYSSGLMTIKLDEHVKNVLSKQDLTLASVPKEGEIIYLRENSNLSTGGDSIDVTDLLHEDIKQIAVEAIRAVPGLAYGGVDFLTNRDISEKPSSDSYIIIEINDSPMISMHHYPYEGQPRDAAGAIVDIMFPETKE